MSRKMWTEDEVAYLERWFPWKGAKWCAERLGRSERSVGLKAHRMMLSFGEPKGHIRLCDVDPYVSPDGNRASHHVITAARNDGVLKLCGERPRIIHIAPVEWADKYIERRNRLKKRGKELEDWYNATKAAELIGIPGLRFRTIISNPDRKVYGASRVFKDFLQDYDRERVMRETGAGVRELYVYNPDDTHRIAAALAEYRRNK